VIRPARPNEAAAITALVLRSKASWGYDEAFMARATAELTVTEDYIRTNPSWVDAEDGRLVAFGSLRGDPPEAEIDLLFVEPDTHRRGAGRRMWNHLVAEARDRGFASVSVVSDPGAEPFYLAMGAIRDGESRSSSTGRDLPRLRLSL
jgi:GNAT superfamily N-acetyltransferase